MGAITEFIVGIVFLAVIPIFVLYLPIGYFRERIRKSKMKDNRKKFRAVIHCILSFVYILAVIFGMSLLRD